KAFLGPNWTTAQLDEVLPMEYGPLIWLLLMSTTSRALLLTLRSMRSVSPGRLLKSPLPTICQSNVMVPREAVLVTWLLLMSQTFNSPVFTLRRIRSDSPRLLKLAMGAILPSPKRPL